MSCFGRNWGGGYNVGKLIRLGSKDNDRLGYAQGVVLKDGDLALCIAHSGDWFNSYRLLKKSKDGKFKLGKLFGAYECGEAVKITSRTFHLLMAGEVVDVPEAVR